MIASPSTAYSREAGEEEHILQLPDGRQLAYARNGPLNSRTVIVFFAGMMSVGTAGDVPEPCREIEAQWISPTLMGMGNTSSRPANRSYSETLAADMTALLTYLFPTGAIDKLYIAGGSYGTVPAQMLYGAPYELFPFGRKIAGCILLAGFSPFKYHKQYAKSLNWQNWFSLGPPSQMPFRLLQHMFKAGVAPKVKTAEDASIILRKTLLGTMDDEEKKMFSSWLETKGRTEDDFISQMAHGTVKSCQNWDGFMEVSDVIHSDWGFDPANLDAEHSSKPMLVVSSASDEIGGSTSGWLVDNYKEASLKVIPGGHISALYYMDEIWRDVLSNT